jgi:alkylated DNA repair dioxygenase AlkB
MTFARPLPTTSEGCAYTMRDLFGVQTLPAGFRYVSDVLTSVEERDLVERVRQLPLQPFRFRGYLASRRIYTFGRAYLFAGQKPRANSSIPGYLLPLRQVAGDISGKAPDAFEQVMVTEYAPGAGIGWHLDRPTYEDIVGISLLVPCNLRLRQRAGKSWERKAASLDPRSAYLLRGAVRSDWQHSIAPMNALRYSITLRTFRSSQNDCDHR